MYIRAVEAVRVRSVRRGQILRADPVDIAVPPVVPRGAAALGRGLEEARQQDTRQEGSTQEELRTAPRQGLGVVNKAVEVAVAQIGREAVHLLGGPVRDSVLTMCLLGNPDVAQDIADARSYRAKGYNCFKLKVGVDIELDEKRLAIVREVAGKEASIKVDANEGWSVQAAPAHIRRLNKYNLAGVETPVPRANPADIAAVRRQVKVPILEHVNDIAYGLALVKAGRDPQTPVAVLARGTRPDSRSLTGTLSQLPAVAAAAGEGPALIVVGDVVAHSRAWKEAVEVLEIAA